MLTSRAKYGLRAMAALAARYGEGTLVPIAELARDESIPLKFLEAILLQLKRSGFLTSRRGPAGGYRLAAPPRTISVADIVRTLDGPLAPTPCVSRIRYQRCEDCVDEATCVVRHVMKEVRDAIARLLEDRTLEDLVERRGMLVSLEQAPMWFI